MGLHLDARRTVLGMNGRTVTLRRLPGTDVTLQAFDRSPAPVDVAAGVQQQDRIWETLHDEIAAASWPFPMRQNDKVVEGSAIYTIQAAWPVHEGPDIIGWRIWAKG